MSSLHVGGQACSAAAAVAAITRKHSYSRQRVYNTVGTPSESCPNRGIFLVAPANEFTALRSIYPTHHPMVTFYNPRARGVGQQDGGGDSDKEAGQQRSGDDSNPDEGEASSGHFWKGPWLSLCSATDAPIADECASDTEGRSLAHDRIVHAPREVMFLRCKQLVATVSVWWKLERRPHRMPCPSVWATSVSEQHLQPCSELTGGVLTAT